MHTVTLTDTEHELLVELLSQTVHDLPHEVHRTFDRDYRQYLKDREVVLLELLRKIKEVECTV